VQPLEPVRTTFRRILSGDDAGRPPWVEALAGPGDHGLFTPGSAIWQVNGSLATLVGGIRALLLQACHPLALAGVEQHSSYRDDPLGRLQRTNMFVTTTTFGQTPLAEQAIERVKTVHRSVVGTANNGHTYSAQDPRLLLWVHVGLVDSMLVAAQHYHREPIDADEYVQQMAVVGLALGVLRPPMSETALKESLDSFSGELSGGHDAQEVAQFLQSPGKALPIGAWAPYAVLSRAAADLLPPSTGALLGVPHRKTVHQAANRAACRALLGTLQPILGRYSQATLLSYQRCGLTPPLKSGNQQT